MDESHRHACTVLKMVFLHLYQSWYTYMGERNRSSVTVSLNSSGRKMVSRKAVGGCGGERVLAGEKMWC